MSTRFHLNATKDRLVEITANCREDMHEPDNQDVEAVVTGNHLDNAMGHTPKDNCDEFIVTLTRGNSVEHFNLATLIALARKAEL